MNIIRNSVSLIDLLAGLAEEAEGLSKAALEYRSAMDKDNQTPVDEDTAYERLCEKIADVKLYCSVLNFNPQYISYIMKVKKSRWEGFLAEKKSAD